MFTIHSCRPTTKDHPHPLGQLLRARAVLASVLLPGAVLLAWAQPAAAQAPQPEAAASPAPPVGASLAETPTAPAGAPEPALTQLESPSSPASTAQPLPATPSFEPDAAAPEQPAPDAPAAAARGTATQGPAIELAPEPESGSEVDLLRGLKAERQAAPNPTTLGGYGELHYGLLNVTGPGESEAEIDLHRLVLFVAHRFDERLRFYAEVEVEHAAAGDGLPGEVGVEQAIVDYDLLGTSLGLRAGVVLVPMGIINQWHEPPIFHGVERPTVDRVIIPSTWREAGLGVYGEPLEGLRYELYVTSGLNAGAFRAQDGLRAGRQDVAEARADGLAVTGRLEVEPVLGAIAGISGYFGLAGPNAELFDAAGAALELDVPVWGVSADARGRYQGLEARAVFALFGIGETDELRQAFDADGNPLGIDVGSKLYGVYGELAYDLLHLAGSEHALVPFVRLGRHDTLASVDGRAETAADDAYRITELTAGITYRPIPQVAFKTDFQLASPDGPATSAGRFDLGIGVMY